MALNANIILSGQQPDFLGTIDQGNRAAAFETQMTRQNKLAQLYQQQGAGLLSGDQAGINALAGLDPQAASDFQQRHRDNQVQEQEIERSNMVQDRDFDLRIQDYKRKVGVEAAAQEAAQIEQAIVQATRYYQSGDLDSINRLLANAKAAPISSLEEFPSVAVQYKAAADALKAHDDLAAGPEWRPATPEEAAQYGATGGQINAKTGKFDAEKPADGMRMVSDGQGGFTFEQGAGVTGGPPKMTVDAAKNTGFLIRTRESNQTLNDLEDQGGRAGQKALGAVPFGLGNFFRDEDYQRFDQARRDFVNAILRRESGAVISEEEFDNANQQYLPVPGDGPDVIEQKRRNRETAIQGLEVGSGDGAAYVDSQQAQESPQAAPQQGGIPDFTSMSDEDLDAYIANGGGG